MCAHESPILLGISRGIGASIYKMGHCFATIPLSFIASFFRMFFMMTIIAGYNLTRSRRRADRLRRYLLFDWLA
ncbi:hypothetical protein CI102_12520 [Trichoderma harzianum]|nr:hypothetical protein CI102_12520 [Trichoderma harzianum]